MERKTVLLSNNNDEKSSWEKNEKSEKCLRRLIKRLIDHLCMGRAGDQTQTFYHEWRSCVWA